MKDFWKRKRNKRIAASALAVVMAGFLVWGLFPWQAAAAKTTVADDVTINKWHDSEHWMTARRTSAVSGRTSLCQRGMWS